MDKTYNAYSIIMWNWLLNLAIVDLQFCIIFITCPRAPGCSRFNLTASNFVECYTYVHVFHT